MATRMPMSSLTINHPKFNSKNLQNVINENLKRFQAFQESLNKISADIQSLEKFLKDCGLNITYTWMSPEHDNGYRLGLAWERTDGKDFRLTVQKFEFHDEGSYGDYHLDEELSRQPLISQSSEIRRLLWTHLPSFVGELSQNALGPVETLQEDESEIPF